MHVFISWSGEKSLAYAIELKKLIENCIQSAKVFCSNDDIRNGENWSSILLEELRTAKFGIVCLTKENIYSPWINFEAGAIANKLNNKMTAMLIDVNQSDIKPPLSLYQTTRMEKDNLLRMILSINETIDDKVDIDRVKKSFDHFYCDFQNNVSKLNFLDNTQLNEAINTKELLKYSKDIYDIVYRIESVMPSIVEQVETISKTDYQKKYGILFDRIMSFLYELDLLEENNFKNICDRFVFSKILNFVEDCMKKDRYLRNRCNNHYESIVNKYKKYNLKTK